ncbi:MAG: lipocalin-like domain-containing protein [Deltaproteobacteria bacterium]|nr:lipocalin-like domain-containing protein [Deltaproteobacteria bacterium]
MGQPGGDHAGRASVDRFLAARFVRAPDEGWEDPPSLGPGAGRLPLLQRRWLHVGGLHERRARSDPGQRSRGRREVELLRPVHGLYRWLRSDGDQIRHFVEVASLEVWNGTVQERWFKIDGDRLELLTQP